MAVDASGNVYVADSLNHTIRRVEPDGTVLTIGGLAETAGSTDGADGVARFSGPMTLAVDAAGAWLVIEAAFRSSLREDLLRHHHGG